MSRPSIAEFKVENQGVRFLLWCLLAFQTISAGADWPMLRGGPAHTGFVPADIKFPLKLAWAREFENERMGTAVEPIVADNKVLITTHAGNLHALRADTGESLWCFQARDAFLQSPAFGRTKTNSALVVAASVDGNLYAVSAGTGRLAWHFDTGYGGFSAAPIVSDSMVHIGTRSGDLLAVALADGHLLWRASIGFPIRQTAALDNGQVYVTAEDLKVRCFSAGDGKLAWVSEQLSGQTARDYYPVIVHARDRTYVVVRTSPTLNMGQRIGGDRSLLCRNANVDDSSWQKLDAWIKSPQARGNLDLWTAEQRSIVTYLATNRDARTFYTLDAGTGKEFVPAPILWAAGCQGVGSPPALTADGRLLVFYRSAYGNWNHGVAPLVALGLLELGDNRITPLFHQQGMQPAWNCFWGTADESQNFLVAGETVLIDHQGTLSGFDLQKNKLFPIYGERDTYGGFKNPAWARNEWHGPGRAGPAIAEGRIYWQTGSRILCLEQGVPGPPGQRPEPKRVSKAEPTEIAPTVSSPPRQRLRHELNQVAEAALSQRWAPLFCAPGLAGRSFSFEHSGDLFEALAWAWPHLNPPLQSKAKALLRAELIAHPPFARQAWYPLNEGVPREYFAVPAGYRVRLGGDKQPHPFGNIYALWLYAKRAREETCVLELWPKLKAAYEEFTATGWQLDGSKGDPFANRYLASLRAFSEIAGKSGDAAAAASAAVLADKTTGALLEWWNRAAQKGTLGTFNTSSELDPFIGKGDGLFLALAPHRHSLGLFQDLTPEIAAVIKSKEPDAARRLWTAFSSLCPTWFLVGEERQVHFGENFIDPPDFAMSGFRAAAWIRELQPGELARRVDLPFCRADLYYLMKVSLALERDGRAGKVR